MTNMIQGVAPHEGTTAGQPVAAATSEKPHAPPKSGGLFALLLDALQGTVQAGSEVQPVSFASEAGLIPVTDESGSETTGPEGSPTAHQEQVPVDAPRVVPPDSAGQPAGVPEVPVLDTGELVPASAAARGATKGTGSGAAAAGMGVQSGLEHPLSAAISDGEQTALTQPLAAHRPVPKYEAAISDGEQTELTRGQLTELLGRLAAGRTGSSSSISTADVQAQARTARKAIGHNGAGAAAAAIRSHAVPEGHTALTAAQQGAARADTAADGVELAAAAAHLPRAVNAPIVKDGIQTDVPSPSASAAQAARPMPGYVPGEQSPASSFENAGAQTGDGYTASGSRPQPVSLAEAAGADQFEIDGLGREKHTTVNQADRVARLRQTAVVFRDAGGSPVGRVAESVAGVEPAHVAPLVDQVVKVVRVLTTERRSEMRVRLWPPHLGELHVRIVHEGESLRVHLLAESGAAREMLQARLPELRYALAELNGTLNDVSVTVTAADQPTLAAFTPNHDGPHTPYQQPGEPSGPAHDPAAAEPQNGYRDELSAAGSPLADAKHIDVRV